MNMLSCIYPRPAAGTLAKFIMPGGAHYLQNNRTHPDK